MKKIIVILLMAVTAPATAQVEVNCYQFDGIEREICENQNTQNELEKRFQELQQKQEDLIRKREDLMRKQEEQMWKMEREAETQRYRN
jgi:hypothetical protein